MENKKENLSPRDLLLKFYSNFYLRDKHDSPDESRTSLTRRIKKFISEGVTPNRVLDIGSGPQALEKQLLSSAQGGEQIKSQDTKFFSIDLAKIIPSRFLLKNSSKINHVQADAVNIPFEDNAFGLVISNHAIDFCPQESAFREAFRVLAQGGKGIFYLHHPSMLRIFSGNKDIDTFWNYLKDNNILFSTEEDIKKFLDGIGFDVREVLLNSDKSKQDTWWEVVATKR